MKFDRERIMYHARLEYQRKQWGSPLECVLYCVERWLKEVNAEIKHLPENDGEAKKSPDRPK